MPKLVLVKHSNSDHNAKQDPADWSLTAEGFARCVPLAKRLSAFQPKRLFCSSMQKAQQTAEVVSQSLESLPIIETPSLGEHSRSANAPYGTLEDFHANIQRLFESPNELIFGDETAKQALHRFRKGIEQILSMAGPNENLVAITHGTVITLFTAQVNALDSYIFWQRLQLPAIVVLELPNFRLCQVIEDAGVF